MTDILALADRAEHAQTCSELCDIFDVALRELRGDPLFRGSVSRWHAIARAVDHARITAIPELLLGVAAALVQDGDCYVQSGQEMCAYASVSPHCGDEICTTAKTEPGARLSAVLRSRAAEADHG